MGAGIGRLALPAAVAGWPTIPREGGKGEGGRQQGTADENSQEAEGYLYDGYVVQIGN